MRNFYKPKTNLKIVYIEEEDFVVKQILDDDVVIYDQRLIKSPV